MKKKILFLHGWHSVVGGVKPTFLRDAGFHVLNPALDDHDFDEALRTAQALYDHESPDVIVGSSRGGAIAMNLNSGTTPMVLLCPAWKNWGSVSKIKSNSLILHSRLDDVIPFEDSVQLVAQSHLPADILIEIGQDHRLADDQSLAVLRWACDLFCNGESIPTGLDDGTHLQTPSEGEGASADSDGSYICDSCGEEIVIPLDRSEGDVQSYVEDCPVCCNPNVIHVRFDDQEHTSVWAEPEQDRDS